MKFQSGQSGNPAGRPLGARNRKTIAMEEELFKHGQEAIDTIVRRAQGGDPTCLRLLMERPAREHVPPAAGAGRCGAHQNEGQSGARDSDGARREASGERGQRGHQISW